MKINVMSFNIRCCDDPNGYSVAERAPRLKSIVSGYNPDVICFQEFREIWEPHLVDFLF
jgi:endonuclease/exonuclease/phosphatase family metal-dependent hydrolase